MPNNRVIGQRPLSLANINERRFVFGIVKSHGPGELIGVVVIAGIMATLFLGGWSIPWIPQEKIIGFVAHGSGPFAGFGIGFANGLCMLIHFATFLTKVVAMIWLQMALRWTLPRFRYDQVMDLCWKIMLPLSLVNIFVTGAVMLMVKG